MPVMSKQTTKKVQPRTKTKTTSISSRVIALEDLPDEGIKLCVYGASGTGKTRFISTFAKKGKLLHMICSSNGMNEARSIKGVKGIDCFEILKPNDLPDLIDYAISNKYKTIALDHVTGFCDLVLATIMGVERLPEQKSWGMTDRSDYQQMGLQVKTYLRELMSVDCNVIIAGQERAFNTSDEGYDGILMPYVSVACTPSVAGWIAPAVDYLCQTFKRDEVVIKSKKVGDKVIKKSEKTGRVEYGLRVGPDAVFTTKFRVPPDTELPDVVINPTYDKISHLIEGA